MMSLSRPAAAEATVVWVSGTAFLVVRLAGVLSRLGEPGNLPQSLQRHWQKAPVGSCGSYAGLPTNFQISPQILTPLKAMDFHC